MDVNIIAGKLGEVVLQTQAIMTVWLRYLHSEIQYLLNKSKGVNVEEKKIAVMGKACN
jgi:hypothetical protein